MAGTLFVVATPIGNLEDITARALRILREAAVIAAEDTRRTSHLLVRYGITTPTISLHEHNERTKTPQILARLERGENVALVSDAGTPTVSDPGSHLIAAAVAKGIPIDPIPGPNAAIAALSASGLQTQVFTFLGFPPTRSKDRKLWLERLARSEPTVVFYESPHRIRQTLIEIAGVVGNQAVVMARELTKAHGELVRGPINDVAQQLLSPKGEFTVVLSIGQTTEQPKPDGHSLSLEFSLMTKNEGLTRRQAISSLSRRHGISAREIYDALERTKDVRRLT